MPYVYYVICPLSSIFFSYAAPHQSISTLPEPVCWFPVPVRFLHISYRFPGQTLSWNQSELPASPYLSILASHPPDTDPTHLFLYKVPEEHRSIQRASACHDAFSKPCSCWAVPDQIRLFPHPHHKSVLQTWDSPG